MIIVFSFNNPTGASTSSGRSSASTPGSTRSRCRACSDALKTSLEIAALSTLIATALGTLTALALVRYEFKGRAPVNFFIFIPLATPEVVLGAALLSQFLNWGTPALGFATILIAHVMFNLSFVVITVRSRLIGFDRSLEEAAQDLGATPWQTFRLVTLPLIMPGVLAAALLAFALSIDDFVITNFNSGSTITFPLFIWGAARVAIQPQIYVIATMIFLVTVAAMVAHGLAAAPRREDGRGAARRAASSCWSAAGPLERRALMPASGSGSRDRNPRSRELHERARGSLLAGVPMSWMTMWAGALPALPRGGRAAPTIVDVDGHEYADFCLGDTGAMAGHSPEPTMRAIARARRHHDDAADRGRRLGRRRAGAPLRPAVLAVLAHRHGRQPLDAAHVPPGDRPPECSCSTGATTARSTRRSSRSASDGLVRSREGNVGPAVDPRETTRVAEFNDIDSVEAASPMATWPAC